MKGRYFLFVVTCLGFTLIGCGTQIGISGKAREDYLKSIKPYLQYWLKEGITIESRREDSFECGGSRRDSQPFSRGNEEQLMQPGETIWKTRERLSIEWVNCMKNKGYRYVDK